MWSKVYKVRRPGSGAMPTVRSSCSRYLNPSQRAPLHVVFRSISGRALLSRAGEIPRMLALYCQRTNCSSSNRFSASSCATLPERREIRSCAARMSIEEEVRSAPALRRSFAVLYAVAIRTVFASVCLEGWRKISLSHLLHNTSHVSGPLHPARRPTTFSISDSVKCFAIIRCRAKEVGAG